MLTGYHFTAYHNWPNIQREGLLAGRIEDSGMRDIATEYAKTCLGSWVFTDPPTDDREMFGQLAFTMILHGTPNVAMLLCRYTSAESLQQRIGKTGGSAEFVHTGSHAIERNGTTNGGPYHEDKPIDIIVTNLPPNRVHLVAAYGISELGNAD